MTIRVLTIESAEYDQLKKFYVDVLEMPLMEEDSTAFTVGLQQTELEIRQHTGTGKPVYHFAINIPANKLEEAKIWLQQKVDLLWLEDYNSAIADFKNWHAKSVYFFDPAGNIVELIARFDLDNETDDPFSSQQFLAISEIGLVFPENELNRRTEQLLKSFNLDYFSKQPPLEHFKAVGDDEGLFIIVPENRYWYPAKDVPAVRVPLKIYFSHNNTDSWLEYNKELQSWCSSEVRFT